MKVLVTGGAGFIGSNLIDALLKRGDTVLCLDNLSTGSKSNVEHCFKNPCFQFIEGSILDWRLLEGIIGKIDVIFHMAAAVGVKYIVDNPLDSIITNVRGTEKILDAAYTYGRKKVIIASSSEIYGKNKKVPYKEEDDRVLGPTNINRWSYSASKAIDEHMSFSYATKGLPVVVLRFFNIYGPRINEEAYGTVVAQFIKQALRREPITVHGTGKQTRSFTYVDDCVKGIIRSSEVEEARGKVFNIGNTRETKIIKLAKLIKKLSNSPSPIKRIHYHDYYGLSYEDAPRRVPDITRARKILGFDSQTSLEEGLEKTIAWCKEHYSH
ncbi:MAG: GDP-mannose 4,6-dehydratase [Candidatus Omnitrophica bacterium]|nr:GDP-mannose 4,6-dehydratase [Candidatus Omnitrophota bacterium]